MLRTASLLTKYLMRKARFNPFNKPKGAQKIKFSQEHLSQLGQAAHSSRMSINKAFKQKYTKSFEQYQQQVMNMKKKKKFSDRQKQHYNKSMPKSLPKNQRIQPQQMTLTDLSAVRLQPQYLPVSYLKQCQKIFHKYGQTRLRQIASNFSKLISLKYRQQKLDFQKYPDLKFQRLQQKLPKDKQIEQIYLIGQQKIYQNKQPQFQSLRKVDTEPFSPEMNYTQNIAISYLLNRAPRTFATAIRLMTQIKYKYPKYKPKSFLDFGGGLSAGSCAFIDIFEDSGQVYNVQPAAKMRKLSKYLTQGMSIVHYQSLGQMSTQVREVDIVYAGYVLNQLRPQLVQVYLQALYTKTKNQGFLVLVQYGSPFGSRLIHQARRWALDKKMYIAAPCPHQLRCPLAKSKNWCHFDQPSGIYPSHVFGKLPTEQSVRYQKYSYLILQKKQPNIQIPLPQTQPNITKQWDRVLYPIIKRGRHIIIDICTKTGMFQRRISAKSHGPQYKQIKRLRWGDFWRFGKRIPHKYRKQRKTGKRLW